MNVNVKLNQFLHCNECCHKDICCIKKDYADEEISIPATFDDFEISIKCKYFQKIMPTVFRDVNQYFPKMAPDPGTGIEYLNNQPTCTAEDEDKRLKAMTVLTQQKMIDDDSIAQIRERLMKG